MLSRSSILVLAGLAFCGGLAVIYGVYVLAPAVGTFHDDGIYLVTARALAEDRGYRIMSVPGEPFQNKYPILFPWLLSLVWRMDPSFPANLPILRLVPLAAALAWFASSWLLLRRLGASHIVASAAVLVTAVAPWVVFLSTMLLAETVFAALMTAGLFLLVRIHMGDGRRYDAVLAGALVGGSLLARAAGVAPVAAGLVALAMSRRWKACVAYAAGAIVVAGPWFWWVALHSSDAVIDPFYSASTYSAWNIVTHFAWSEKLNVLIVNSIYLSALGQLWGISSDHLAGHLVGLACSALVVAGLWKMRTTPVAIVVSFSAAMLLIYVWPPTRYVVPLIPLLAWLAYVGAGRTFRPVVTGLAVVLVIFAAIDLWKLQAIIRQKGATASTSTGWVFDWRAMSRQLDWIAHETPPDAVLATIHDPTYYLFTGRKGMRPFEYDQMLMHYNLARRPGDGFGEGADFGRKLFTQGVDFVIVTPRDQLERLVGELLTLSPGSLSPVMGEPASGYVIYRVDRDRLKDWVKEPMARHSAKG
jgi:hypothetical protein